MHHYVLKVDHQPTLLWLSLDPPIDAVFLFYLCDGRVRQAVEHPVAGTITDDEIIRKVGYFLNVDLKDIFSLFVFECIYDGTCKFQCIQSLLLLSQ